MAAPQQFSLRWNNYSQHIVTALEDLRADDELVDVTLSCEGQRIRCHKILLSACSTYFRETFKENPCKHPVIIIKGVSFLDCEAVVTFMYNGQVNVSQDRLQSFLAAAELLQIKGLTDMNEKEEPKKPRVLPGTTNHNLSHSSAASRSGTPDNVQRPPSPKRKRMMGEGGGAGSSSGGALSMLTKSLQQQQGNNSNSNHSDGLNSQQDALNNGNNEHDPFAPDVSIKYEDHDEDEYDEKSHLSGAGDDQEEMMCSVEPVSIGSFTSGGAGGLGGAGTSGNDSSHGKTTTSAAGGGGGKSSTTSTGPSAPTPQKIYGLNSSTLIEVVGRDHDDEEEDEIQLLNDDDLNLVELTEVDVDDEDPGNGEDEYYEDEDDENSSSWDQQQQLFQQFSPNIQIFTSGTRIIPGGSGGSRNLPTTSTSSSQLSQKPMNWKRGEGGPNKCSLCDKTFLRLSSLRDHKKSHYNLTTCQMCNKSLSTVANLKNHYIAVHMQTYEQAKALTSFVGHTRGTGSRTSI